jgi:hypothetical protein
MIRLFAISTLSLLLLLQSLRAAEKEERSFAVIVDGKSMGTATMTFESKDKIDQFTMVVEAKGRVFLTSFHYKHKSAEFWSQGKLVAIESTTYDDGKQTTLSGKASEKGITLTVNKKEKAGRADVVTSSGWRLPAGLKSGQKIVTLDTEDGSETTVTVEDLGPAVAKLDGKEIPARKNKLSGKGVDDEWWFDGNGRPVRQNLKWDGQKVTLELTAIKR